ncbi:MAG: ferredoxin--NADP reductase [candidate division Zixibacteria bacterium]|nr:ferredoxin--NADP reductase [candidate division Zixibacteria bacterium]MBU1469314.1 ferredoxin--NADP reductase [candidate division Zixibacteria bacterium]
MPEIELNAKLIEKTEIAPGLMILRIAPVGWSLSEFFPGQYAMLGLPASAPRCPDSDPEQTDNGPDMFFQRSYSITSTPDNLEYVEFYVTLVKSGAFSPRLFALNVGDKLRMSKNFSGLFTLLRVPEESNLIFLATGTGLSPCLSMIRSETGTASKRRIALIHSARRSSELGFSSELAELEKRRYNFTYIKSISRPHEEAEPWKGNTGYVQDLWSKSLIEKAWGFPPTPDNTHVFVSGNPAMCDSMTDILLAEGYKEQTFKEPGELHLERFW